MRCSMIEMWKKHKIFTLLCIIGVVYFFLKFIVPLVAPVLVAMLFVTICGPFLKKIQERLHVHRQIGAVLLLVLMGVILLVLFWLLFTWIMSSLPQWLNNLNSMGSQLEETVKRLCDLGSRVVGMENTYLEELILHYLDQGTDYLQSGLLPNILSGSVKYVKEIAAIGGFLLLFVIASVFLAKDYDNIMNGLLNRQDCHILLEIICGIIRYIATFVKAQAIIMLVVGSVCAIGLSLNRIPSGVFWGILAGALDVLPFLGTGIVLVPLTVVQILEGSYVKAVVCLFLYVGCIFIRELLEPKLIGKRMGIPPLAVLTTVYAGIRLFGVAGIIKGPLGFVLVYQTCLSLKKREKED